MRTPARLAPIARIARSLALAACLALAAAPLAARAASAVVGEPSYHGNVESRIFHSKSCRYFDCKKCVVEFASREQAERAGYRPCKVCRP